MIVPSLFSNELLNLPQAAEPSGYTPEYFNKIQQYYSGYLPGQTLDTEALADWYKSSGNIPFGGTSFATAPSAAAAPSTGLLGGDTGGGGGGDSGMGQAGPMNELDDAGLARAYGIDPRAVQGIGLLGTMLGIPFASLVGGFKNPLSSYLTEQSYKSAVAQNTARVAAQLGLDPNNPANAAAIAAAVDSLSAANQGTTAATTGPTGTGGVASTAAQQAASSAAALGFSDAAIGAASQAAANAALAGATAAAAAQAGVSAAAATAAAEASASQSISDQSSAGASDAGTGYGTGDTSGGFGEGQY